MKEDERKNVGWITVSMLVFILATLIPCSAFGTEYDNVDWGSANKTLAAGDVVTRHCQTTGKITITGAVTVKAYDDVSEYGWVTLTAGEIEIQSGGSLSANEKGYGPSTGPAAGIGEGTDGGAYQGAGGAGYGGEGGDGDREGPPYLGGSAYGDSVFGNGGTYDWEMGSGGGNGESSTESRGGKGAGKIKLDCSGIITISGTGSISANGEAGQTESVRYAGGGGSGGSIWIIAGTLAGSGAITANGGAGADNGRNDEGGGGGGGRIHIEYANSSYTGKISVNGGTGGTSDVAATDGQIGSILVQQSDAKVEILVSPVDASTGAHFSREGYIEAEFTDTDVTIKTGKKIVGNVYIKTTNNITIESGAEINANYKGYDMSEGTGAGTDGDAYNGAGGAGYVGLGGNGDTEGPPHLGGSAYTGNETAGTNGVCAPCSLGSGGGSSNSDDGERGGNGGGRIKLECGLSRFVFGTIIINGTISANGGAGQDDGVRNAAGGGSGGSIWIRADSITGSSGAITANGGAGGDTGGNDEGGGGSGGRVALIHNMVAAASHPSGITVSVNGGTGPGTATDGAVGTKSSSVLPDPPGDWQDCDPLAVELISFDAIAGYKEVLLSWLTEVEIDNKKWLIGRSLSYQAIEKSSYEIVAEVPVKGVGGGYIHIDSLVEGGVTYWYLLGDISTQGDTTWHYDLIAQATPKAYKIFKFTLHQSYPNPFVNRTTIRYTVPGKLPSNREPNVSLKVYNLAGKLVRTLVFGTQKPGIYRVCWNGKNNYDKRVPAGIYFYCLETGKFKATRKLTILR